MKLLLGAGRQRIPGWLAVDLDESTNPDVTASVHRLPMFASDEIEAIRAVDVLEHLPYRLVNTALAEWHRILQPGGTLFVQVPDFGAVVYMYLNAGSRLIDRLPNDVEHTRMGGVNWRLMGGQDGTYGNPDFNVHLTLFDEHSLCTALLQAGFHLSEVERNGHPNLLVTAVKP